MRAAALGLVLLCGVTFFAGLGRAPISDSDEAFYAEAGREMLLDGDWLTPHYNFQLRFQKPILFYWLVAFTYLVAGVSAGAARFWSAVAGLAIAWLTYRIGRRFYDDRTGWLAGAITATCFGCFAMARLALPDLPLAFFISLTIYAALVAFADARSRAFFWLVLSATAAALGFLTKGPIAIVIPGLVIGAMTIAERRRSRWSLSQLTLAAAVFAGIALPWYAAMGYLHGAAYLSGFFIGDNFERFATTRFNDPRPFWFYGPVLLGGMLPWSPCLLLAVAPLGRVLRRTRRVSLIEFRLLAWTVLPLLLLTASVGKQPRYILPVLPPAAILLARALWVRIDTASESPRRDRLLTACAGLVAVTLLLLAVLLNRAHSLLELSDAPSSLPLPVLAITAAGGLVAASAVGARYRAIPRTLVLAAALTLVSVQYGLLGAPRVEPVERMAALVTAARHGAEPLGAYQVMVRNLVFYTRVPQTDLSNEERLLDFLRSSERVLTVIGIDDLARAEARLGARLPRLAELRYFSPTTIKPRTLLSPDPALDLDTVVLVSNR